MHLKIAALLFATGAIIAGSVFRLDSERTIKLDDDVTTKHNEAADVAETMETAYDSEPTDAEPAASLAESVATTSSTRADADEDALADVQGSAQRSNTHCIAAT